MLIVCFLLKVLSVTYVRGGTAFNVIPSYVEFGGTLRSLTTKGLHQLRRRLIEVPYYTLTIFNLGFIKERFCWSIGLQHKLGNESVKII